jgi:glycosyltransferase involved in cell wall biosynthesis
MNRLVRKMLSYWPSSVILRRFWNFASDQFEKRIFRAFGWRRYVTSLRSREIPKNPAKTIGRLYIDISAICQDDAATGIQRVVRAVAFLLGDMHGPCSRLRFVYTMQNRHYIVRLEDNNYIKTTEPILYKSGDTFFGLDYSLDTIWRMRRELRRMKLNGVRFWYLVHDFLPYTHPEWFSAMTALRFYNWLAVMAGTADGFFCVSQPVAHQLHSVMARDFGISSEYAIEVIPMGWDISDSRPSTGLPENFDALITKIRNAPSLLMVGTIEPRKGHREVLQAMEVLWRSGSEAQLVLVGGEGWKMSEFVAQLVSHSEIGERLFWVGKVSDEALGKLYGACSGVLVASLAEGFGLPLVEALGHAKPVLARRLEVFEVHAGHGLTFFDKVIDTKALAVAIADWLSFKSGRGDIPPGILSSWKDTANFISKKLMHPSNTTLADL